MRTFSAPVLRAVSNLPVIASVAAALMLGACSSAMDRLTASNVSDQDPVYTASVPKKQKQVSDDVETADASAADDNIIAAKPLAKKPVYKTNPYVAQNDAIYGAQKPAKKLLYKQPSYETADAGDDDVQAMPANTAAEKLKPIKNGTVVVGQGMTLYSIAKANGLTVAELASANNIDAPYGVKLGQTLRIPGIENAKAPAVKSLVSEQEDALADEQSAAPNQLKYKKTAAIGEDAPVEAVPSRKAKGGVHTVAGGETLFSLGRKYGVNPYSIAALNGLPRDATLKLGQSVKIPGGAGKAPVVADAADETVPAPKLKKPGKDQEQIAAEEETAPAAESAPKPKSQVADAAPAADPSLPAFRWPVRGKIISPYGQKPSGARNEGVNISVPEGTSVRSAESGVVAYAGNELKGYGNLVLIRHEGGWVTAYAHNKELFVKRGDTVKRGDVIAKAGQTGSVSSPQLHFEVRKGATAMDPMKFLNAATAAN